MLHAGEVGRGCGVFGKVESNGKVCFFFLFSVLWRSFCFAFSFFGSCVSVCMPVI